MRLWFPLAALIVIVPATSYAAETGQEYGLGVHTCGEFAKLYSTNPTMIENVYFGWAEGFMSGLNFMAAVDKMPSRKIDSGDASMRSYQSYIREYCNEHPLARYADAVATLWNGLPKVPASSP